MAIALLFAVSGCKIGGDDSSKSEASPKPRHSPTATGSAKKAGSYTLPAERITVAGKLSLPKMEGWKYGSDVMYVDTSSRCNDTATSPDFSCPLLSFVRPDGPKTLKDIMTQKRIPCNSYAPFQDKKPVGSDVVDGLRVDRYYSDMSDCKTIPEGSTRDSRSTFWIFNHGGEFFYIIGIDAPNGGPKFDVEKMSFALRHAKWLS
ncbi:MAG TPA: hypothetical protein VJ841_04240 [Candidatus Saccharimonadales bacterium]|nr:hypothetical protein [Candidatus Saccharimonadales bacterium]